MLGRGGTGSSSASVGKETKCKKIDKIQTVEDYDLKRFNHKQQEMIDAGYEPFGKLELVYNSINNGIRIAQTFVKYNERPVFEKPRG